MSEEKVEPVPGWLSELEARRERKIKAKLGHETGAGSPCTTCKDKCPGLDLHFWRKTCKNCKCKKENHDIQDDIHSWAEFELLGSKPNKNKTIIIPGRNAEVTLEWAPQGDEEIVEKYLKDLPPELLPVKGSQAEKDRKMLLQKQIPFHDIDPSLCHALTDDEIKQMNDYIMHLKDKSVGVGSLIEINFSKAAFLSDRVPTLLPNSQIVQLQGSACSNMLKESKKEVIKNLQNMSLNEHSINLKEDMQNEITSARIKNIHYNTHEDIPPNYNSTTHPKYLQGNNKIEEQIPINQFGNIKNLDYATNNYQNPYYDHKSNEEYANLDFSSGIDNKYLPNYPVNNKIDEQLPNKSGNIKNIYGHPQQQNYEVSNSPEIGVLNEENLQSHNRLPNYANSKIYTNQVSMNPQNLGGITNINYPTYDGLREHFNDDDSYQQDNIHNNLQNNLQTDNKFQSNINYEDPINAYEGGNFKTWALNEENLNTHNRLPAYANSTLYMNEETFNPEDVGGIKNISYPAYEQEQYPIYNIGGINQDYIQNKPQSNNKFKTLKVGENNSNPEIGVLNEENLNSHNRLPMYANSQLTTNQEAVNPQNLGGIRNVNYPAYGGNAALHPHGSNDQLSRFSPNKNSSNNFRSNNKLKSLTNIAPTNINIEETSADPTSVNVGLINDVEFPIHDIKLAETKQNNIYELPIRPNKSEENVVAKIPKCHRCHKNFNDKEIAVTAHRSSAMYHTDCFKCPGCNQNLANMIYFYDKESDEIYCGRDYAKIRGIPRCNACDELIFVKEYCLTMDSTYHLKHFCCYECDMPLAGHNYVIENSQTVCLPCFERLQANKCHTCKNVIKPDEQGASLMDTHFHANDDCFSCKMCKKPLLGIKFMFKNNELYCSRDCFQSDQ